MTMTEQKTTPQPPKATMSDVAERAGVSAATVARVLYNNGYVKQATRSAVEAAVVATGYRPNILARGLRTSRTFTLGLVVSESRLNAFHPAVAHVIQMEALHHGYTVLTLNNHADPKVEAAGVQRFLDHHVDGVIFCTAIDPRNVRLIAETGIPTVQVERHVAHVGSLVDVDASKGMRESIDHLWELGHRRIAYIGGLLDSSTIEGPLSGAVEAVRERLFRENLSRHGAEVLDELVVLAPYYDDTKPARQPGHGAMVKLLDLPRRPTAVICGSDLLAASALQAISEAGLAVPRDISIIGYDDSMAEILTPALSSIAQPIDELGRIAVKLAINAIDAAPDTTKHVSTETHLVMRESTAAPV